MMSHSFTHSTQDDVSYEHKSLLCLEIIWLSTLAKNKINKVARQGRNQI